MEGAGGGGGGGKGVVMGYMNMRAAIFCKHDTFRDIFYRTV